MFETFTKAGLILVGAAVFITAVLFAVDREAARIDYENYVRNSDYEKTIKGCMWNYNCEYYTNLLRNK